MEIPPPSCRPMDANTQTAAGDALSCFQAARYKNAIKRVRVLGTWGLVWLLADRIGEHSARERERDSYPSRVDLACRDPISPRVLSIFGRFGRAFRDFTLYIILEGVDGQPSAGEDTIPMSSAPQQSFSVLHCLLRPQSRFTEDEFENGHSHGRRYGAMSKREAPTVTTSS